MASVQPRRLRDGTMVYRVMFRIEGRQKSESFGEDSTAAQEFCAKVKRWGGAEAMRQRDARTKRVGSATPLLKDWLAKHIEQTTSVTEGTKAEYRRLAARTWLLDLGELPLDAITRNDVRRWLNLAAKTPARTGRRAGQPLAAKTLSNAHGLLSTVLASAVEAGHIPGNVARGIPLPNSDIDERVFLTAGELAQLIGHIPAHWHPLVALLAGTGLRFGEATALRWGDLDFETDPATLRVVRAWKHGPDKSRVLGPPKTRRSQRTVSLPSEVADMLRPLAGSPLELVFTTAKDRCTVRHDNFHRHVWKPAVAAFAGDVEVDGQVARGPGKRPRIHDLRHSHASSLIASGVDILIVQQRLGHESAQTTLNVYGHTQAHAGRIAAAATSSFLSAAFPALEEAPTLEVARTIRRSVEARPGAMA